jgi:hypothetical protein
MADLTIAAADVRPVRIGDEHFHTAPALETFNAGQYIRLDPSTGKFRLGNASDPTEIGDGYFAGNSAANIGDPVTGYKYPCVFEVGSALSGMNFGDKIYLSATDGAFADANVGAHEKQTVTITGSPTGGTFTLTLDGQTTAAIAYNATAATVEAALEALSTIGQGNVQVTGAAGGPYTVEFVGELADRNVSAMTADGSGLTGGTTPGVTIATATAGVGEVVAGTVVPGFADTTAKKLFRIDLL